MKRLAVMIAVVIACSASAAPGQTSSRADFEEYCQAMQGRWVGSVTWVTDWPGFGKKGEKVTTYSDIRMAADGNAILGTF